jgi:hypothetical protein
MNANEFAARAEEAGLVAVTFHHSGTPATYAVCIRQIRNSVPDCFVILGEGRTRARALQQVADQAREAATGL